MKGAKRPPSAKTKEQRTEKGKGTEGKGWTKVEIREAKIKIWNKIEEKW